MFQNLQGTAIHTYANKILVHTVTIPSPLVVALPSVKGTRTRTGLKISGSGPYRAGPGPDTGAGPV